MSILMSARGARSVQASFSSVHPHLLEDSDFWGDLLGDGQGCRRDGRPTHVQVDTVCTSS